MEGGEIGYLGVCQIKCLNAFLTFILHCCVDGEEDWECLMVVISLIPSIPCFSHSILTTLFESNKHA